jgi:hypothetical protein
MTDIPERITHNQESDTFTLPILLKFSVLYSQRVG